MSISGYVKRKFAVKRTLTIFLVLVHLASTALSANGAFAMGDVERQDSSRAAPTAVSLAPTAHDAAMAGHCAGDNGMIAADEEACAQCGDGEGCACCYLCCSLYLAQPYTIARAAQAHSDQWSAALAAFAQPPAAIFHPPKP